ncbi:MAG: hypothetical protein LUF04_13285 [Bacteroides sp.]|nr:hypothetical protein [Bacteroides sp.]
MKTYYFSCLYLALSVFFLAVTSCASCSGNDDPDHKEPEDPIHTYFSGEVKPPSGQPCFQGAYYRKMVSSKDKWLGIGGTVTLPEITFDENRKNPAKPGQYLDNPSLYLGGNMGGQETDIGLTWEVIREANGTISAERKAFRPFIRWTAHASGQASGYKNAPAEDQYYWYPGDKVTISLEITEDNQVRFIIEGAGKRYEEDIQCEGYKRGNTGEFKRVNAIDQVSNEGKPIQATGTQVENSRWDESWLLRMHEGKVVKAPMHSGRATDMRCPDEMYFNISATDAEKQKGAETINISGGGY